MDELQVFIVECEDAGARLDVFLAQNLAGFSRSGAQKLIAEGRVLVGGAAQKPGSRLKTGDNVAVRPPEPLDAAILAEDIPIEILYEDADLIVIDKPQGMVVHPAPGHYTGTLVNALMFHCGDGLSGINGELRPGIVHRIDKDTSGLLVAAKTNEAHISLSEQFARHSVTRYYTAVVWGDVKGDGGVVDKPLCRDAKDRKRMAVARPSQSGARRAVTHYGVLERFGRHTLIRAQLKTGRTHQIRVHMAHIGHPVLGDPVYAGSRDAYKLDGQALHAAALGFVHPRSGAYMEFEAPPPEYFVKLIDKLRHEK